MKIGTSKKVGEIDIKDLEVLESSNRVVVAIKTSRKAIVEEEVEGEEGAEGEEATAEGDDAAAEAPAEA